MESTLLLKFHSEENELYHVVLTDYKVIQSKVLTVWLCYLTTICQKSIFIEQYNYRNKKYRDLYISYVKGLYCLGKKSHFIMNHLQIMLILQVCSIHAVHFCLHKARQNNRLIVPRSILKRVLLSKKCYNNLFSIGFFKFKFDIYSLDHWNWFIWFIKHIL